MSGGAPSSIIDLFQPVRLREDQARPYRAWQAEQVVTLLRLGLLLGAALYSATHLLDRLIDVEVAEKLLPLRGMVSFVILVIGGSTYLPVLRRLPDPLMIALAAFLSLTTPAILFQLPVHAGFALVAGELVIGIFAAIIVQRFWTVTAIALLLFVTPLMISPFLGGMPEDLPAAYVFMTCGCAAIVLLGYLREQDNKRAFQLAMELERAASTDALTKLANRARILDIAEEEVQRSDRFCRPVSVLMMDIDRFKSINDRHGHAVGDMVLKAVAETCVESVRGFDRVGRTGGEEFLIVLSETDKQVCLAVAERVRQAIEEMEVASAKGRIPVTASIGAATHDTPRENFDSLLLRADKALYRAKAEGRNRVVAAPRHQSVQSTHAKSEPHPEPVS